MSEAPKTFWEHFKEYLEEKLKELGLSEDDVREALREELGREHHFSKLGWTFRSLAYDNLRETLWASGENEDGKLCVFKSTDLGQSFNLVKVFDDTPAPPDAAEGEAIIRVTRKGHIFVAGENTLYKSRDGVVWKAVLSETNLRIWGFAEDSMGNLYACQHGSNLYKSMDDGETWTLLHTASEISPGDTHFHKVFVDEKDRVWVTVGDGPSRVMRSTDGGETFTTVTDKATLDAVEAGEPLDVGPPIAMAFSPRLILLTTEEGRIWYSCDDGVNWNPCFQFTPTGVNYLRIDELHISKETGIIYGRMCCADPYLRGFIIASRNWLDWDVQYWYGPEMNYIRGLATAYGFLFYTRYNALASKKYGSVVRVRDTKFEPDFVEEKRTLYDAGTLSGNATYYRHIIDDYPGGEIEAIYWYCTGSYGGNDEFGPRLIIDGKVLDILNTSIINTVCGSPTPPYHANDMGVWSSGSTSSAYVRNLRAKCRFKGSIKFVNPSSYDLTYRMLIIYKRKRIPGLESTI